MERPWHRPLSCWIFQTLRIDCWTIAAEPAAPLLDNPFYRILPIPLVGPKHRKLHNRITIVRTLKDPESSDGVIFLYPQNHPKSFEFPIVGWQRLDPRSQAWSVRSPDVLGAHQPFGIFCTLMFGQGNWRALQVDCQWPDMLKSWEKNRVLVYACSILDNEVPPMSMVNDFSLGVVSSDSPVPEEITHLLFAIFIACLTLFRI